jgi:hypothetical protein
MIEWLAHPPHEEGNGLLPEDHEDIRIVPDAVRRIWEPRPPKLTSAKRRAAKETVARYRRRIVDRPLSCCGSTEGHLPTCETVR